MSMSQSGHTSTSPNQQLTVNHPTTASHNNAVSGTGTPGDTIAVTIYGPTGEIVGTYKTIVEPNGTWALTNAALENASRINVVETSPTGDVVSRLMGVTPNKITSDNTAMQHKKTNAMQFALPNTGETVTNTSILGIGILAAISAFVKKMRNKG
ncbi:hypothetical protein IV38_GL001894 [Lactobacillus selangorensis]|uniref:Uncharacterized protein n=2 Tax=Lactobacillus selangorensis TaxID=81857 RepID=A0A0R2FGD5_9LACO|nr:hypothetical protein IV38_GL001894 [Lactobacillus selangorensis]KRN30351.1 hypothetical protein IV40_GL001940 [Lactobacillus selangorensis]